MFRHLTKANIFVLILVSLVFGGVVRFAFNSSAATSYTLSLVSDPSSVGSLTGGGSYTSGTRVNIKASIVSAYQGFYIFKYWLRTSSGTTYPSNPLSVLVDTNKTFKAVFWPQVTVSISPSGGGYVSSGKGGISNCGIGGPCTLSYERLSEGTKYVNLTAYAKSGYKFSKWTYTRSDQYKNSNNNTLIKLDEHWGWKVTANFTKIPTVTVPPPTTTTKTTTPTFPTTNTTYTNTKSSSGGSSSGDDGSRYEMIVGDNSGGNVADENDKTAPTVPGNFAAKYDSETSSTNLTWDESTDNVSVSGYEIQRRESGGTDWENIGDVAGGEFTDFEFEPDRTYEYQVRAYDDSGNYSSWSTSATVVTGEFSPNVTATSGGNASDKDGAVSVEFPAGSVDEDLVILIEKVKVKGLAFPESQKLAGSYYNIRAKNAKGEEIKNFKRQIELAFNLKKQNLFGINKSSLKIATVIDEKTVTPLPTEINGDTATTLTDHFSLYFLAAQKTGFWGTLLWVLFWIAIIGGLGYGAYLLWRRYQLSRYQEDHAEDYIYKH